MQDDPDDAPARLRFLALLADSLLFLLLAEDAASDSIAPRVFPLEDGPVVLAFDSADRLALFAQGPVPHAELPGRAVAAALAGQGLGLGLNLGVAPSSILLPPEAVDWLAGALAGGAAEAAPPVEARPVRFDPPFGLPAEVLAALDVRLARAGGLAAFALLAGVLYADGRRSQLLAFVAAAPGAEAALARSAGEALRLSGADRGAIDVTFLAADDPSLPALLRVALRVDLPPLLPDPPAAPGSDPTRAPRLR
jgi:hypothetical protein